jgi:hypothetical protein
MDRRLPTAALLSLLFISLTAAAIMDDGCTRELWEQRPDGEYIQVRRNVCGGTVIGREALGGSTAAAVIGREAALGGSAAAVIGRASAVVTPIVGPVIRDDAAANETAMVVALSATPLPPSPSPPVVESSPPSSFVSAGKLLLLKKLKLLALGALMLG